MRPRWHLNILDALFCLFLVSVCTVDCGPPTQGNPNAAQTQEIQSGIHTR